MVSVLYFLWSECGRVRIMDTKEIQGLFPALKWLTVKCRVWDIFTEQSNWVLKGGIQTRKKKKRKHNLLNCKKQSQGSWVKNDLWERQSIICISCCCGQVEKVGWRAQRPGSGCWGKRSMEVHAEEQQETKRQRRINGTSCKPGTPGEGMQVLMVQSGPVGRDLS